jgi:hypothetical protein
MRKAIPSRSEDTKRRRADLRNLIKPREIKTSSEFKINGNIHSLNLLEGRCVKGHLPGRCNPVRLFFIALAVARLPVPVL